MSYTVATRMREFGIMLALGAELGKVLKLILDQGARLALLGAALGLAASFAVMRLLAGFLFGVSVTDPLTIIAVPIVLMFVALAACYIPARRATKVDPLIALRYE